MNHKRWREETIEDSAPLEDGAWLECDTGQIDRGNHKEEQQNCTETFHHDLKAIFEQVYDLVDEFADRIINHAYQHQILHRSRLEERRRAVEEQNRLCLQEKEALDHLMASLRTGYQMIFDDNE